MFVSKKMFEWVPELKLTFKCLFVHEFINTHIFFDLLLAYLDLLSKTFLGEWEANSLIICE